MTWLLPIVKLFYALVGLFREERLRADGARAQREKDAELQRAATEKMANVKEPSPSDAVKRLQSGEF